MEVNVTKRIETPNGDRYCPVVLNGSGRIKPDWVIVNGNVLVGELVERIKQD